MLPSTITLPVDLLNNGTTTDFIATRDEVYLNRSVYTLPEHTIMSRDILGFYRTRPTVSGNYRGTAKSAAKFTEDVSVPGVDSSTSMLAPLIGEVNFAIPVGVDAAKTLVLRQRLIALIDHAIAATAVDGNSV